MSVVSANGTGSIVPHDPGMNRVLVVDDDLVQRMMLVRILRSAGYESATAMSNQEARTLLEGSTFGLVISDLHMFAEDGIELVRHVSEFYPDMYSIVVSGFVTRNDVDGLRRAGAFELMSKPVDKEKFLELVDRAFEHRAESVAERRHKSG